jgi:competence protein ComEC
MLKRPSDLLNSLFAAALIILLWEPRELFQAGFQLSFVVVLCIILILPFFKRIGEILLRPDPLRPESLQPLWQKALREAARLVADLFLVSIAAWLGSIPLVAWYFHLITPLSGPANVLAVPLCTLVLICNLASLAFASWLPFLTEIYNYAGWFFMDCIRVTSSWSAHWPGAYYYVPMPGIFTIGLYYLILITALTGWLFQGGHRKWKISAVALLAIIWCGVEIFQLPVTHLAILPLDGGHAIYVKPAFAGSDWLIDCGNESAVVSTVKPFLEAQGVNRLSNLILTHGEASFSGGAESVLQLFKPHSIYLSPIHFRSPNYRAFQTDQKKLAALRTPIKRGDTMGPWQVLYPPPESALTRAEDNALVLRGEFSGTRVLLLSDLSHAGQNALLNLGADIHADIVVASLPGDGEPLSDPLLNAIQPRAIIVADSQEPANKKAGYKLKRRLEHHNLPILYTSASDAATLSLRGGRWELTAMDGTKFSGVISASR